MAFTQSQLVDLLFKKTINFVSNTKPAGVPGANEFYNEGISSFPFVQTNQVWLQSDQIPTSATTSVVTQLIKVQLTPVTGAVQSGITYSFYDVTGTLVDVIPPSVNSSYALKLYKGDGVTELSTLNNGGYGDMFFDTSSGVLTFYTPTGLSLGGNPWVQAYKYIGKKGVIPNLSGLTYSAGTMSLVIGTGLTFSGGTLIATTQNPNVGLGLTSQGVTFSVLLNTNSGLTVSNSGLSINLGSGLTVSSGLLSTTVNVVAGSGLTSSGNTFSVQLQSNSGLTVSNSGLSLSIGSGLTVSGGLLSTTVNVVAGGGLTSSGNTFSVQLQNNSGLTVSNSGLSVNLGSGLTLSNGLISTTNTPIASNGLTSSGNTFSVQLQNNSGLTISSSGMAVSSSIAGAGLSFNSGVLSTTGISFNVGNGLNNSGGTLSVILDNTSSLTFSGGNLTISGRIAGNGLTLSSGILINTAIPVAGSGLTSLGNTFSISNSIAGNGLTFSNGVLNLITGVNPSATNSLAFYSGSGTISGTLSVSNLFLQSGNSFGAVALLGTNDNNNLQFETNGVVRMQIGTSGNVTIGNTTEFNGYQLRVVGSASIGGYLVMTQSSSVDAAITVGSVLGLTAQSQKVFIGVADNNTFGNNTGYISFGTSLISSSPNIQFDGTTLGILNPNSSPNISIYRNPTNPATIIGAGIRQSSNDVFRFTFDQTQGQLTATQGTQTIINGFYNVNSSSTFGPTSGSARFMVYGANGNINQTGSASGVVSLISDDSLTIGATSLSNYRAYEATKTGGYGFYQTSTSAKNFFGGRSSFGLTTDDGSSIVQVYGTLSTSGLKITSPVTSTAATYSYLIWNSASNNVELSEVITGTPIMMYSATFSFTGSVTQTFTHSLASSDFIIQMYDTTTGDEVMAQYSNRSLNTIDITVFEAVTARIVIIG